MCSNEQWASSMIRNLSNGSMCSAVRKHSSLDRAMSLLLACLLADRGTTRNYESLSLVSYDSSSGFFPDIPCRRLLQVVQANNIVASMTISV